MLSLIIGFLFFGVASILMIIAIVNGSLHPAFIAVVIIFGIITCFACLYGAFITSKTNTNQQSQIDISNIKIDKFEQGVSFLFNGDLNKAIIMFRIGSDSDNRCKAVNKTYLFYSYKKREEIINYLVEESMIVRQH